jgi:hypothetical protein
MTGDHHGRTAARATLQVTATDEILGTHRVWISITKNTRKRLRNPVSMCRKSHARIPGAWEVRNCRQAGDARPGRGCESGRDQDPADRSRADAVPEA